jgi:hypothetical protein
MAIRVLILCLCISLLNAIDLALSANAAAFFQHPVIGSPSYDNFNFSRGAVYSGRGILPWVVNGFLYSVGSQYVILAGEYPHGYAGHPGHMRAIVSNNSGEDWTIGPIVVQGNMSMYDRNGSTPDGSVVIDGDIIRMVYDWGSPVTPGFEKDGGLGYAEGPTPFGPFVRSPIPVVQQSTMPPMPLKQYQMVYGGTLLKRGPSDWLILSAISTHNNGGGTWGMCCLTSSSPTGPWSPPTLLLYPQSSTWHPTPVEFFPAFQDTATGYVYAPATGLAGPNRNYQVVFRALLASAHLPSAWDVLHDGSVFHWENRGAGFSSIWGQTFSAFVDGGMLRVMYPSVDENSVGSMNFASVPWVPLPNGGGNSIGQRVRGFFVSAPSTPALALTTGSHTAEVGLELQATLAGASMTLLWNHNAPVGSDTYGFPTSLNHATPCDATAFVVTGSGFQLLSLPPAPIGGGECVAIVVASGSAGCTAASAGALITLNVSQSLVGAVDITCNGVSVVQGASALPQGGATQLGGRVGLLAGTNSAINVSTFVVAPGWAPSPLPVPLLAIEGLLGYGVTGKDWTHDDTPGLWRFNSSGGFVCSAGSGDCEHAAKFSFTGVGCVLWAPKGVAGSGIINISIDGGTQQSVDLASTTAVQASAPVWTSAALTPGRHAVVITTLATLPLDSLDFLPTPVPSN